jgi:hypothetical protein
MPICKCGCKNFSVLGYFRSHPETDETFFYPPISLKCSECEDTNVIFTPVEHGAEGFWGNKHYGFVGSGTPEQFSCEHCGKEKFELICEFEYSDGLFEEIEEKEIGNEHNIFSMFTLLGACQNCKMKQELNGTECA